MQFIKPDVSTTCIGQAASMGAFLLAGGCKGKRFCLPNARTMIHQPSGGAQGQATDIDIHAREILFLRERLNQLMADHTGQDMETRMQRWRLAAVALAMLWLVTLTWALRTGAGGSQDE